METLGRVALVTGAARRVGRAIALELARAGCDVAVHYGTSAEAARSLKGQIESLGRRVLLVHADLADPAAPETLVRQVIADLGRLDILVNNASGFDKRALADSDPAFWTRLLQVNLVAPALLARAAAPHMRTAGAGRIINLCDILADRPPKGYAAYCTSKAGLAGMTRCLARELAPEVTVNGIAPGIAEFPQDYDQATRDRLVAKVPLQRAGTPEDVAALARFLIQRGDYITGQIIPIDGGRSIRL